MEKKPNFFKRHKKLMIVLIIIAAIVIVLAIYIQKQLAAFNALLEAPPEIVTLEHTDLESKVTASGNFESVDPVTVGSNVQGGEVETVYVSEGDRIEAGDVLAVLKTSDLKRDISDVKDSISEANKGDTQKLESAQRAFNDADAQYYADLDQNNKAIEAAQKKLDEANAAIPKKKKDPDYAKAKEAADMAQEAYDKAVQQRDNTIRSDNSRWYEAKAQLDALAGQNSAKQSRSQLESLEEDLSGASITSSISGIVTTVNTEAGKAASGDMFTVENTESLQITATIAEYDVIKVKQGMTAHVTSNALGSQLFDGIVDFVAPVALDTNGNFEVRVLLTSPAGELRPGMTATVEIITESKQDIFAVPIDAVVTRPDGKSVVYAYEPAGGGAPGQQGPPAGNGDGPVSVVVDGASGITTGTNAGANYTRREIEVQTGMETDYYIEISGEGLSEGLLLLADPEGKNVVTANPLDQINAMMGPGGGAVRTETISVGGAPGGGPDGPGQRGGRAVGEGE
ncbi:MAG: efflux RND transporter periplasmic adaptor subunit [Clostridiales Family XIII bacterium]|jgi:multidrug efflux pump subunit AcrA (membrane-fusion protein)|nr:efflux RND transporter periplasmic adaptor subunit [Clostridiales Family XIII bacterium]